MLIGIFGDQRGEILGRGMVERRLYVGGILLRLLLLLTYGGQLQRAKLERLGVALLLLLVFGDLLRFPIRIREILQAA
jgi:hypothetical protein